MIPTSVLPPLISVLISRTPTSPCSLCPPSTIIASPAECPAVRPGSALKCQVSVQDVLWSSSLVGLTRLQCRPTALLHYTPFILGVQRRKLQFNSLPNPGKKRHKFLHKQAERVSRPAAERQNSVAVNVLERFVRIGTLCLKRQEKRFLVGFIKAASC